MRTIVKYWRAFISLILLFFSKFIVRKNDWIAFGSWRGELFIDNSRYLFETAISKYGEHYRFVWIGDKKVKRQLPDDNRVICCKKNSFYSLICLLKCKYMFCSQMHFEDISNYNVYSKAVLVYLHHGCPVKMWGDDAKGKKNGKISQVDLIIGKKQKYNYFVCSSEAHFKTNLSALKSWGCVDTNNLRTGTPRNDMLVNSNKNVNEEYKKIYAEKIGFAPDKRVVLYVPTFRRSGVDNQSLIYRDSSEEKRLNDLLEQYNCVLIEKAHFVGSFNTDVSICRYDSIISCPKDVNIQEMLLFTDCVISDYSGALLDYSILDRPVIHYIYDFEYYRDIDSGLYYDFLEFQAGPAATTFDELLCALEQCLKDPSTGSEMRKKVKQKFMEYEKGNAAEQILNIVIK